MGKNCSFKSAFWKNQTKKWLVVFFVKKKSYISKRSSSVSLDE